MEERLQKIIANAGLASRRAAERLIREGRVSVNGQVVTELGVKADPDQDHVKVDGKLVRGSPKKQYILLNKPRQVVSTREDPEGRLKVTDLVKVKGKVYPVGRLDYNTEGLILLTNDGEFARIVTKAGDHLPKVYEVKVQGVPEPSLLERLRAGTKLRDGTRLAPAKIVPIEEGNNSWLEITLNQGHNRQIRKMFEEAGHRVMKLRRKRIGFLSGERLAPGEYRSLTTSEVDRILRLGRKIDRRP